MKPSTLTRPFLPVLITLALASVTPRVAVAQDPAPAENADDTADAGELAFLEAYYQEHGREDPAAAERLYAEIVKEHAADADLVARSLLGRYRCLRALSRDAEAEPVLRRLEAEFATRTDLIKQARSIAVPNERSMADYAASLLLAEQFSELKAYGDVMVPHVAAQLRAHRPSLVTNATRSLVQLDPEELDRLFLEALADPELRFPHLIAAQIQRLPRPVADALLRHEDERTRSAALLGLLGSARGRRGKSPASQERVAWVYERVAGNPTLRRVALDHLDDGAAQRWLAWAVNHSDPTIRSEAVAAAAEYPEHLDEFRKFVFPTTEAFRADAKAVELFVDRVVRVKPPHGSIEEPELLSLLLADPRYRRATLRWLDQAAGRQWAQLDPSHLLAAFAERVAEEPAPEHEASRFTTMFLNHTTRPTTSAEQLRLLELLVGTRASVANAFLDTTHRTTERTNEEWQRALRIAQRFEEDSVYVKVLDQLPDAVLQSALERGLRDDELAGVTARWMTHALVNGGRARPGVELGENDYDLYLRRVLEVTPHSAELARAWLAARSTPARAVLARHIDAETPELQRLLPAIPPGEIELFRDLLAELIGRSDGTSRILAARQLSHLGASAQELLTKALRDQPEDVAAVLRFIRTGDGYLPQTTTAALYRTALEVVPPDVGADTNLNTASSFSMLAPELRRALAAEMLASAKPLFLHMGLAYFRREPDLAQVSRVAELAGSADPELRAAAVGTLESLRAERERRRAVEEDALRGRLESRVDELLQGDEHARMAGVAGLVALEGRAASLRLLEIATDDKSPNVRAEARKALLALGASD